MTGSGVFVDSRSGRPAAAPHHLRRNHRPLGHDASPSVLDEDRADGAQDGEESDAIRLFDSVNLTLDCMDEDMQMILLVDKDDGNGEDSLEELDDDFCFQASREPEQPVGDAASGGFDYDEHVRQLLERARRGGEGEEGEGEDDAAGGARDHPGAADRAYFTRASAVRRSNNGSVGAGDDMDEFDDDDEEYDESDLEGWIESQTSQIRSSSGSAGPRVRDTKPRISTALSPEEERALCDKFLSTLAEYDDTDNDDDNDADYDDDDADYDDENERNGEDDKLEKEEALYGPRRPLEGDAELEAAMDDFLYDNEDDILVHGVDQSRRLTVGGGSGYSVLVGTRMVPTSLLNQETEDTEGPADTVEDVLAEADATLAAPVQVLTLESVITVDEFDGKSYFSERTRNPWDCESILSTYSNLDNNPAVIHPGRRRRKVPSPATNTVPAPQPIRLSSKTGLPIQRASDDGDTELADYDALASRATGADANKGTARDKNESKEEKRARKQAAKQERHASLAQRKALRHAFGQELHKRSAVAGTDTPLGSAVFRYS
jgi:protein LTV1